MAIKIIRDIRINLYKVVFGKVDDAYLIAIPELKLSGYLKPLTDENRHENIMVLSDIFKRTGFRNITYAFLCINTITDYWINNDLD